ncbi:hypothetical protein [Flavobacterium psychrophilum]|uniref:hypothetical protein n=1 Tax=Flavobacterium psychrophilum TaxID=96345 RepID=UPI000B7C2478|nr:hypothetical protein [Flavobacterium psychrophilum]ELM3645171.1 hypothetical protein [Flavobacterium psychrophilum]MCB6089628.1 hypothetical protein [Flavobacterium psychrophilum]MCB6232223.1 hypothetical protein [Flavobacterium psychrophilum]SNA71143.1 hypothetical protein DK095_20004 [Flavobacterium psychrophilum]SNA76480.1 hypothetical protein DK150_380001 [Flavobacterium psychrophilum]
MNKKNISNKNIDLKKEKEVQSIKEIKKSEWFKLFVILAGIVLIFVFFFDRMDKERQTEYYLIKGNNQITRGIITKISLYKGHSISVKFKTNGVFYTGSDGFDSAKCKDVGDSILIKFYVKDPNVFITELNNEF